MVFAKKISTLNPYPTSPHSYLFWILDVFSYANNLNFFLIMFSHLRLVKFWWRTELVWNANPNGLEVSILYKKYSDLKTSESLARQIFLHNELNFSLYILKASVWWKLQCQGDFSYIHRLSYWKGNLSSYWASM